MATFWGDILRLLAHSGFQTAGNIGSELVSSYLKPGMEAKESYLKSLIPTIATAPESQAEAAAKTFEEATGQKQPRYLAQGFTPEGVAPSSTSLMSLADVNEARKGSPYGAFDVGTAEKLVRPTSTLEQQVAAEISQSGISPYVAALKLKKADQPLKLTDTMAIVAMLDDPNVSPENKVLLRAKLGGTVPVREKELGLKYGTSEAPGPAIAGTTAAQTAAGAAVTRAGAAETKAIGQVKRWEAQTEQEKKETLRKEIHDTLRLTLDQQKVKIQGLFDTGLLKTTSSTSEEVKGLQGIIQSMAENPKSATRLRHYIEAIQLAPGSKAAILEKAKQEGMYDSLNRLGYQ